MRRTLWAEMLSTTFSATNCCANLFSQRPPIRHSHRIFPPGRFPARLIPRAPPVSESQSLLATLTLVPIERTILGAQYAFWKAWRNLSGPMGFQNQNQNQNQNQTLGRDRAASRQSAPGPGKRTRREDHALSHRPQMSSDRATP